MKKEYTEARCVECGRKVSPKANIAKMFNSNGPKRFVYNHIYTYWDCKAHGAVWAEINGEIYPKPSDLFDSIVFDDWEVEIKKEEG